MEKLKKHIHDDSNGLDYVLVGDYYIPDLQLPEESRPIGRWGRMHREYLQEYCPDRYNELLLSGKLWTYLADLDEQVQNGDITYCVAHHNMAIFYAQTDNPVLSVDVIPIGRVTSDLSVFENLDSREEVIFSLAE